MKVLVVDDEPQIRRALSLNLAARSYEVVEATSGEAALTAVADEHPDIVLLDLGLPGMDGLLVLEALRPDPAEVAETASAIAGRTIELEVLAPEAWVAAQVAAGTQEFMARFLLGMYQAAEQGFFAGTDPLLADLLGREPQTVRDVLERPAVN